MNVVDADLEAITRAIWATLPELPSLDEFDCVRGAEADAGVTSIVHISGEWDGAVTLQCPMSLAATLTAAIFQVGAEPEAEDVRDAMGELANMVAGNVKALLPEPCGISLPTVALGRNYRVSVVGTVAVAASSFSCDGDPLVITLLARPTKKSAQ